ncbi:hypothetical protein EV360DRAFT_69966 [Lentinula raphanica]|nr:hypothetical protein EV360DRAFT_69966 [Lentinula raphanica]
MLARILLSMTATCLYFQVLIAMQSPVMASPLAVQQLSSLTDLSSSGEQSDSHSLTTRANEGDATAPGASAAVTVEFGHWFLGTSRWIVFNKQEVFQYEFCLSVPGQRYRTTQAPFNQLEGHNRLSLQDFGFKTRDVAGSLNFLSTFPLSEATRWGIHPVRNAVEALVDEGFVTAADLRDSRRRLIAWLNTVHWQPLEFFWNYPRSWGIVINKQEGYKISRPYQRPHYQTSIITYNRDQHGELEDFGFEMKVVDRSSFLLKEVRFPNSIYELKANGLLRVTNSTKGVEGFENWYKEHAKVSQASDKGVAWSSSRNT